MFTPEDLQQLKQKGISPTRIEQQLFHFRTGFPKVDLVRAATSNDGIEIWNTDTVSRYETLYAEESAKVELLKFVPASGAATRMFQSLFEFTGNYIGQYQTLHKDFPHVKVFLEHLERFPFYKELEKAMSGNNLDIQSYLCEKDYLTVVNYVLNASGLNYGNKPKALIMFHRYGDVSRNAMEEHLVEGAMTMSSQGKVSIQFTVSAEHREEIEQAVANSIRKYEEEYGVPFHISYSEQKSSTDVVAVDMNNHLLRDKDGALVFRPGGHGALLTNLNECQADVVFIKNIDNVQTDRTKPMVARYKKALAGRLLEVQRDIFSLLKRMDKGEFATDADLAEIERFVINNLHYELSSRYYDADFSDRLSYLKTKLNRPIRVCGMVKNEGEPGGGPFWVKGKNGEVSLQIVETAQIDSRNPEQQAILDASTHFNPVDLVCGLKNYCGQPFDLMKFVEEEGGFISVKTRRGHSLKAQELPGLWNAGMADWNTLFVEVPGETFSPVKTINDLLRAEHQC